MCCVPGRGRSNGCRQLGAKAGRQAAVMTAFDTSSSASEQSLCHLLSLHTRRWAPSAFPHSAHLSFCAVVFAERRNA